jgi:hypothetical protein
MKKILLSLLVLSSFSSFASGITDHFSCSFGKNYDDVKKGQTMRAYFIQVESNVWLGRVYTKRFWNDSWGQIEKFQGQAVLESEGLEEINFVSLNYNMSAIRPYDHGWGAPGGSITGVITGASNSKSLLCGFKNDFSYDLSYTPGNNMKESIQELINASKNY